MELLRKSQAVTPEQQTQLLAAFDEGSRVARGRILDIVDQLQKANFGQALIQLDVQKKALREDARALEGALRSDAETLLRQGRKELEEFLARNQPTLQAMENAGHALADAGKELAASLKYAGREAADELWKRGKAFVAGTDTEAMEQAAFDWAAQTAPQVERAVVGTMTWASAYLVLGGVGVAATLYPPARPYLVLALAVALFVLGLFLFIRTRQVQAAFHKQVLEIQRLSAMGSAERRRRMMARLEMEEASLPGLAKRMVDRAPPQTETVSPPAAREA